MNVSSDIQVYRHRHKDSYPLDCYFFGMRPPGQAASINIYGLHLLGRMHDVWSQSPAGTQLLVAGTLNPMEFNFDQLGAPERDECDVVLSQIFPWVSRLAIEAARKTQYRIDDFLDADVMYRGTSRGFVIGDLVPHQPTTPSPIH